MNALLRRPRYVLVPLVLIGAAIAASAPARSASRPLATIVEVPFARSTHPEATFRWKSRATSTACRRDNLPYRPCGAKVKYSGVAPGRHTFTLRAKRAGRTVYLRHRWTVLKPKGGFARPPAPGVNAATIARGPNSPKAVARQLVFSDEFNGTTVDTATWLPHNGPGHANYGLRRPSAVAVDGRGRLVITGRMQGGRNVAGGLASIRSNFTYGRVAFRERAEPDPTGTMSAVVLTWPKDQWSPEYTENDMYETGPRKSNRRAFDSFIHFGPNTSWQKLGTHEVDPSKWHTIAMEWYPDLLEIYVDGLLGLSISDPAVIPDIPHHVNVQLDARANRKLERPVRMFVDYVRVYQ